MDKTGEHHKTENRFLARITKSIRDIVFGLEDGLVSTLGVITGIAEGSKSGYIVVLSGLVVIFVEALSMAAGSFLSAKSEKEVKDRQIEEEKREIEEVPKEEKKELYEIYLNRGLDKKEAKMMAESVFKHKDFVLEEMTAHELGIGDHRADSPKINALFMWISYVIGGFVPLASYFFLPIDNALPASVALTVAGLFVVGAGKTVITKKSWWKSGLEMTIIALAAAGLGFAIGKLVSLFLGGV